MKIKYIGKEFTEVFGLSFKPGEVMDVTDEYAIEKLRFNPQFEAADAKDKPKKGEAPKAVVPGDDLKQATERALLERSATVNKEILADIERKKREG